MGVREAWIEKRLAGHGCRERFTECIANALCAPGRDYRGDELRRSA